MNYPDIGFRKAVINNRLLADPLPFIVRPGDLVPTVKEQVKQAQQELTRLQELDAATQQRDKIAARIDNELALAEATTLLLKDIHKLVVEQVRTVNGGKLLSRFIKELQPLAQTHGTKIVKVGNGEQATLVLASAK